MVDALYIQNGDQNTHLIIYDNSTTNNTGTVTGKDGNSSTGIVEFDPDTSLGNGYNGSFVPSPSGDNSDWTISDTIGDDVGGSNQLVDLGTIDAHTGGGGVLDIFFSVVDQMASGPVNAGLNVDVTTGSAEVQMYTFATSNYATGGSGATFYNASEFGTSNALTSIDPGSESSGILDSHDRSAVDVEGSVSNPYTFTEELVISSGSAADVSISAWASVPDGGPGIALVAAVFFGLCVYSRGNYRRCRVAK
jgi:hypothetical protein